MKLVRLIKICLNKTFSRDRIGKHLSDTFPVTNGLKRRVVLSPFIFSFALEYAIRSVQVKQDGLKFNGRHQLLVSAGGVYVLD